MPAHSRNGFGAGIRLACAALIPTVFSGCLFGGEGDLPVTPVHGDTVFVRDTVYILDSGAALVQPGLYRLDYSAHLEAEGIDPDSFGVVVSLLLEPDGRYRLLLADTFYAGPIPLIAHGGLWMSIPGVLVQSARLYGESFPDYYLSPGLFFLEPRPTDEGPVRAVDPQSFQRYEEDMLTGANHWATYRRVDPGVALSGSFTLLDTVLDENNQPVARSEEWTLTPGGLFRVREYYDGVLSVETISDRWLQPGAYVSAVNPRRRFFNAGTPGAWDTLSGDLVHTLRNVGSNSFEKLDALSWYDVYEPLPWVTFRKPVLGKAGAPDSGPGTRAATAHPARRPAGLNPAGRPWNRSAAQPPKPLPFSSYPRPR